jgi:hypothetical protein
MSNNTDSRSVHTDALATLGTIIDDTQKRDAIHLAVIPMVAPKRLAVGQHVDKEGNPVAPYEAGAVGIVDPFLHRLGVDKGEYFWLVIYPRVITSLRHVWAHPAFEEEQGAAPKSTRTASEQWMMVWARKHMSDDYYGDEGRISDESAYAMALEAGRSLHIGPYEDARDHIDNEWWSHWEAITGEIGQRGEYFSCGC